MQRVAKFEKVSFYQFYQDCLAMFNIEEDYKGNAALDKFLNDCYEKIKLPQRATRGSNGYDFFMPFPLHLRPYNMLAGLQHNEYVIPTGIRCKMSEGWGLFLIPRSGIGSRYGFRFVNTIGDIDSDYYCAGNEGHIKAVVRVDKALDLEQGQSYMQGVFLPFGITDDDNATAIRRGGYGSTDLGIIQKYTAEE